MYQLKICWHEARRSGVSDGHLNVAGGQGLRADRRGFAALVVGAGALGALAPIVRQDSIDSPGGVAIDTIEIGRGDGAIRASRAMPADGDVEALAVVLPELLGEPSATWAYCLQLAEAGFCALAPEPASLGVGADRSRPQHLNEAVATARIERLVAHVRGMRRGLPVRVTGTGGGGRLVWRAAGADLRDFAFYCGSGCTDALAPIAWPHTLRWLRDA
jgi:hypothetical protein